MRERPRAQEKDELEPLLRLRVGLVLDEHDAAPLPDCLSRVAKDGDESQYERYGPRLCFLDLETTGLAGGAGTQAFLVGCAAVEDGGLRVRQFLLPGFEHERALLAMVAAWTEDHDTLVTFNGPMLGVTFRW